MWTHRGYAEIYYNVPGLSHKDMMLVPTSCPFSLSLVRTEYDLCSTKHFIPDGIRFPFNSFSTNIESLRDRGSGTTPHYYIVDQFLAQGNFILKEKIGNRFCTEVTSPGVVMSRRDKMLVEQIIPLGRSPVRDGM
jgi:hypothetical protein